MRLSRTIIIAAGLSACGPQAVEQASDVRTDSGVNGASYEALTDKFANLGANRPDIKMIEYGKSVDGLPLRMLRIGLPAVEGAAKRPAVLITEATHGNEYLDVGYEIAAAIAGGGDDAGYKQFFAAGGVALIVPVVNPDGYEYHRTLTGARRAQDGGFDGGNSWGRANKNRKDLNRDYAVKGANVAGFTQPESKAMAAAVKAEMAGGYDLKVSIDYHCCVGSGALLFPLSYSFQAQLPAADLARVRKVAGFMQDEMPQVRAGTGPSLIGYAARGTSNDHFYEQYGSASFVYEGRGSEKSRVAAHKRAWSAIMADASVGYEEVDASTTTPRYAPDIKILVDSDATNAASPIRLGVGVPAARKARLCRGELAACVAGEGKIEFEFAAPTTRTGAVVFAPPSGHAGLILQAQERFTILLDDGADLRGATFYLSAPE